VPPITNNYAQVIRQQMDESNHDMVQMLTQQMGAVFNPLIQNTTQTNQVLAAQMTRIADFFGVPQTRHRGQVIHNPVVAVQEEPTINQIPLDNPQTNVRNQEDVVEQPRVEIPIPQEPRRIVIQRGQDADAVLQQRIRYNNPPVENNLAAMVETIMAQNGMNMGLQRPSYASPLSEYILQEELPPRWKVPKFTKFSEDTSESTIEHVARYLIEAGEIARNENLKIKYFPSSLTKNAFTWFTSLPANSVYTWTQLERLFHEQFYMGQTKISLKELASVKRKHSEPIDDYLNRFRLLKARCFTPVPEHELVEMAVGGLDYSIRKKLDT